MRRMTDNSGAKKAPTSLLIGIALNRVSPSLGRLFCATKVI